MSSNDGLVRRRLFSHALARLKDTPVLLLEGPRSVGKSTMLRQMAAKLGGRVVDLDNDAVRRAVSDDPGIITAGEGVVMIDEYQRAPEVLDAIKVRMNETSRPGQFVLTGSSRHEALPRAAQALTGRLEALQVLPLTQQELAGSNPMLIEQLMTYPAEAIKGPASSTSRQGYIERVIRGGFPLALARYTDLARARWFDNYVRMTIERDVSDIAQIRKASLLPDVLDCLAGQTAQVLNAAKIANTLSIRAETVREYIRLLNSVFLTHRLEPWDRTLTAQTRSGPKVHLIDSGVAMRRLRLTSAKLDSLDPLTLTEFGHPFETFVVNEIIREASWNARIANVGQWRESDQVEVDLIVEDYEGGVVAFEVKAGREPRGSDFKGLYAMRDKLGERFVAGVVMCMSPLGYTKDDRIHVLPVDRLWQPN